MLHDRNPMLVVMADKYLLREHARSQGVATVPLLHVTEDPESIPFETLPPDCMIKASHGSGWNIMRRNGEFFTYGNGIAFGVGDEDQQAQVQQRLQLSRDEVVDICKQWLQQKYSPGQWAYSRMIPRVLVEEVLQPRCGDELMDYRFYTFDGVVKAINVGSPSYRRDNLNAFFRPDWEPIKLTRYREKLPDPLPAKPETLEQMLDIASRLGKGIDFARIDLYDTEKGVMVGEMTAYPEGGNREAPSGCPRLNWWLGRQWKMPLRRELSVRGYIVSSLTDAVQRRLPLWQS